MPIEELQTALSRGRDAFARADMGTPAAAPKGDVSEALLDASGMAAATGVPASWWESAARAGTVPCHRIGRWVRFDYAEVHAATRTGISRLKEMPPPVLQPAKRLLRKA